MTGSSTECRSNFLSVEGLQEFLERESKDRNEDTAFVPVDGLSYIFPSLQFTATGYVEKWVFAATALVGTPSISFQIWRMVSGKTMLLHNITLNNDPSRSGLANVYELSVVPPQPVEPGDFIGIQVSFLSVGLKPQWIPGTGSQYQRVLQGLSGLVTIGRALPLFAALLHIQGNSILFTWVYNDYNYS